VRVVPSVTMSIQGEALCTDLCVLSASVLRVAGGSALTATLSPDVPSLPLCIQDSNALISILPTGRLYVWQYSKKRVTDF
jgi:hypothetical protein